MYPNQFLCRLRVIPISDFFNCPELQPADYLHLFAILSSRKPPIAGYLSFSWSSFYPYYMTLHIIDLVIRFFEFLFSLPLVNSFIL